MLEEQRGRCGLIPNVSHGDPHPPSLHQSGTGRCHRGVAAMSGALGAADEAPGGDNRASQYVEGLQVAAAAPHRSPEVNTVSPGDLLFRHSPKHPGVHQRSFMKGHDNLTGFMSHSLGGRGRECWVTELGGAARVIQCKEDPVIPAMMLEWLDHITEQRRKSCLSTLPVISARAGPRGTRAHVCSPVRHVA